MYKCTYKCWAPMLPQRGIFFLFLILQGWYMGCLKVDVVSAGQGEDGSVGRGQGLHRPAGWRVINIRVSWTREEANLSNKSSDGINMYSVNMKDQIHLDHRIDSALKKCMHVCHVLWIRNIILNQEQFCLIEKGTWRRGHAPGSIQTPNKSEYMVIVKKNC